MPTSHSPQALQAPSLLLLWFAPSLFLAYTDRLSRPSGRFALLKALRLLLWRLAAHIPSPLAATTDYVRKILGINKSPAPSGVRSASRAPDRNKPKLFAVRRADYRTLWTAAVIRARLMNHYGKGEIGYGIPSPPSNLTDDASVFGRSEAIHQREWRFGAYSSDRHQ